MQLGRARLSGWAKHLGPLNRRVLVVRRMFRFHARASAGLRPQEQQLRTNLGLLIFLKIQERSKAEHDAEFGFSELRALRIQEDIIRKGAYGQT